MTLCQTNLLVVGELVPVLCCHGDDLCPWGEVLSDTARIATVLVKPHKLRNLIILVNQLNGDPRTVVEGLSGTVLRTKRRIS